MRALVAWIVTVAGLVALVPTFAWIGVPAGAPAGTLVVALLAITALAVAAEVRAGADVALDGNAAIALVTTVVAGPLASFAVLAAQELVWRAASPDRRGPWIGCLATICSFGWGTLVSAAVLAAVPGVWGIAAAAGLFLAVNYAIARGIYGFLVCGRSPWPMVRAEFVGTLPITVPMLGTGVLAASLVPNAGVAGLLPLAVAASLPELVAPLLAGGARPSTLSAKDAEHRYADALADVLRLSWAQRERLAIALDMPGAGVLLPAPEPDPRHAGDEQATAARAHPIEERVLFVAQAWAELTCRGSLELTPAAALDRLARCADRRGLDAGVLDAARRVLADDDAAGLHGDTAPVLHRRRGPLPRAVAQRMLRSLSAA